MENLTDRLVRVLKLEPAVFGEIGEDQSATGQAILVAALAAAIGNITGSGGNVITRIITGAIGGAIGLFIWTGIVFLVGRLFKGQADYMQLLRGIGFSAAPYALAIVPVIGGLVGVVYSLIIQIRAVREINRVSDGAAAATVLIPFAVIFLLVLLVAFTLIAALIGLADAAS
jgi:hypothetical protein